MRVARSIVCLCAALLGGNGFAAQGRSLDFRVWLGDREIGSHRFEIVRDGLQTRVVSKALYKVKVLFVTVFNYEHTAKELWEGPCMVEIESETVENDQQTTLTGRVVEGGFAIARNDERSISEGGCVGTYAYWDVQRLQRDALMNAQTGSIDAAQVQGIGEQPLPRLDAAANAYQIETDQAKIKLWYSNAGEWLALETTARGRPLVYLSETLAP